MPHQAVMLSDLREFLLHKGDVVQQVDRLLVYAIERHISDIHIEPDTCCYRIRLRQDGLLYEWIQVDFLLGNGFIARLKVLGNLDVSEKRLPQDGHFLFAGSSYSQVDCRLSTCPTIQGEKLVVRILNANSIVDSIEALGFESEQKSDFMKALSCPQGLILFIGPTGSGKTISIYTALAALNTNEKNIVTIEDPVEISRHGINQVNVNRKIGLTFAAALRLFLRQDPDVIMLGEIRDAQTAQVVMRASQTGHLILSTLHAKNTVQAFERLWNLELHAEQLKNNLLLLVAQRLLRKLCDHCKQSISPTKAIQDKYQFPSEVQLFESLGCERCHLGYRGRIGVFELLPINAEVYSALSAANYHVALSTMLKENRLSLRDLALRKVSQGLTSLAEVDRVIPE